jgi:hypothetical protein
VDTGFVTYPGGAGGPVYALAVQADTNVVIGGSFNSYASFNLARVARAYPDGTRDGPFVSWGINNIVEALAVQSDGRLLIGGTFTAINNSNCPYFGRLYGNVYPPEFLAQPVSRNTNAGATVTFSATVSNPTAPYYQWRKEGLNITGATDTSYRLSNVQLADSGNYSVFVSNGQGGITSSNAMLNVGILPAILQQPLSFTNGLGTSNSFGVSVFGSEPLLYQWFKAGTAIADATNSRLPLPNLQSNQIGYYYVTVTNLYGWAVSSNALLTIPGAEPAFLMQGLAAYYPFDGNASDASGNGNNGTVNGAVLAQDRLGAPNAAYSFNGSSSSITFSTLPLTQVDNWTVSTWVNPASLSQTQAMAVAVGLDNGIQGDGYAMGVQPDGSWTGLFSGLAFLPTGYTVPETNRWYHMAMLRDAGTTRFFVNGTQTTNTYTDTPFAPSVFTIGAQNGTHYFNGLVDDVRIYGRALSSAEVQQLYMFESPSQGGVRLDARLATDGVHLSFPAVANSAYSVLFATNVPSGPWQKLADVAAQATNTTAEVTDSPTSPQRYYRVVTPRLP